MRSTSAKKIWECATVEEARIYWRAVVDLEVSRYDAVGIDQSAFSGVSARQLSDMQKKCLDKIPNVNRKLHQWMEDSIVSVFQTLGDSEKRTKYDNSLSEKQKMLSPVSTVAHNPSIRTTPAQSPENSPVGAVSVKAKANKAKAKVQAEANQVKPLSGGSVFPVLCGIKGLKEIGFGQLRDDFKVAINFTKHSELLKVIASVEREFAVGKTLQLTAGESSPSKLMKLIEEKYNAIRSGVTFFKGAVFFDNAYKHVSETQFDVPAKNDLSDAQKLKIVLLYADAKPNDRTAKAVNEVLSELRQELKSDYAPSIK